MTPEWEKSLLNCGKLIFKDEKLLGGNFYFYASYICCSKVILSL